MALKIKHVADLLTMHFNIPNYQRGYRWENKHIEALLDDLFYFAEQMEEVENKSGKFYCVQPLAVVKNIEQSTSEYIIYDVIDGQQRLTTIYLLLSYLEDARKTNYRGGLANNIFMLKYESRDADFFINKDFKRADISESIRNIDFFYMTRAYLSISQWFEKHDSALPLILKTLIPMGYKDTSNLSEEEKKKAEETNDKKNDVRFIWYEITPKQKTDSIEVFNQLNYGKTPLTSTELIKALLLQCDIYTEDNKLMREIAFRRSCEWDTMEKQLQNPFMWSMLMAPEDTSASHISFILAFVSQKLYAGINDKEFRDLLDKNSTDFSYQIFNRYLGNNADGKYAERVKHIWNEILSTYTAVYNWYINRDSYHLIGLLIWLKEFNAKKGTFLLNEKVEYLQQLLTNYENNTKEDFIKNLKVEIARLVYVEETKKDKNGNSVRWGIEYINYNDSPKDLIRILVLFNVEQLRQQQEESARFPFHLLREHKITSLEHIHPQNLNLDNVEIETLREWLDVKKNNLKELKLLDEYQDHIDKLRSYLKDKSTYEDNKIAANDIIAKIDKKFNDLVEMVESQMHTLYNMALVDRGTNSALSNNLLDKKRSILINNKTYVLPATRRAFSKYYSEPTTDNPLVKLWTKPDRDAYFKVIQKIYLSYTSLLKK